MILWRESVGHSSRTLAKQHLGFIEHHGTFPVNQTPFKKIYLLASLKTHSAYYQAAGYTNGIKRKRKLQEI